MSAPIIAIRKAVVAALDGAGIECLGEPYQVFDSPVFGLDPADEVPCIQVSMLRVSGERKTLATQFYDMTYTLVIRVIARGASDSATLEADVADALADADEDIQNLLLATWKDWAPDAKSVTYSDSDGLPKFETDALMAKLDIVFNVVLEARRTNFVPTGLHSIHTEISPKPKATAGWEA